MKKTLAIIPARGGSKRIPGKNKKTFLGKPLIQWTFDSALQVKDITDIIVTTDDEDILKMSHQYPKIHFYKRPAHLSEDESTSVDAVLDVLHHFKKDADTIILLQVTSPFRTTNDIEMALQRFKSTKALQLVSGRKCREIPSHIMKLNENGTLSALLPDQQTKRTQDWKNLFVLNGAIYITDCNYFLEKKSFVTDQAQLFEMNTISSIDIDTPEDWTEAEKIGHEL